MAAGNPLGIADAVFVGITDYTPEGCEEAAMRRNQSEKDLRPLVLVADDEPLIRSTIIQILQSEGYDAVAVKDGVEAVDCARKIRPDIFLADVAMPRLNGIDAAKEISRSLPSTRVICFSGHGATSELITTASRQGYKFEYLHKPIDPDVLIRVIKGESD